MVIGLIDVDGHNYPNLPLMKLSAYHKECGDDVNWYYGQKCEIAYKSKVFSFTPDYPHEIWAEKIRGGGTGYHIHLVDGKEVFDGDDESLPEEIEHMYPDYSLYGIEDTAYGFLSRGCPRGCSFCHVATKEGKRSRKVADLKEFWDGQKNIVLNDPNIMACKDSINLLGQLVESGAMIEFNQGLDIRLMTPNAIELLNKMRVKRIHFAWDNPNDDLEDKFKEFSESYKRKYGKTVYVLTNFNSTIEEDLYRIYTLRDIGYDPYVMIYDKEHADAEHRKLQRWCNNIRIFKTCKRFEDYQK